MLLKDAFSDRKNLVRGLCDASLIAANISQLRAVLDSDPDNKFYIPLLTLIGLSLLSHIVFGIIIIQMWREKRGSESKHATTKQNTDMKKTSDSEKIQCEKINCTHCKKYETYDDLSILVVFFLVVFNVAISGLGLPTISQNC